MVVSITSALVQKLRRRTGAGFMDCKRALESAEGDLEKAVDAMRKSGQVQAEQKSRRIAAEGLVSIEVKPDRAVMVEINCETDFVSRDEYFKNFTQEVVHLVASQGIDSVESLLRASFSTTKESVEHARQDLVMRLGENIQIRRLVSVIMRPGQLLGTYVHMGRIGAIVQLQGGDAQLAKGLALHIIANSLSVISSGDISDEVLAKEREIFVAQAEAGGKPQAVVDKMVEERMEKFLDETVLLRQSFVQDETIRVKELLEGAQARVVSFVRYAVGEGIEKPAEDFAEAVMSQVNLS